MEWQILIAGFCGGVIRGLVGFIKHQFSYKNVKFDLFYFLTMTFLSGFIGMFAAYIFKSTAMVSLIVGYAGGDFIENIYKIALKKSTISFKKS
ncbi:hypothetical protein ISS06_00925 [Patescibacteria group bacterium]|nr:hypothetical protein [Patescibacteria group bacterium]